ncbi:hypothetical protein [Burkholderia cepacia]|uniref:hypothetical protein n=1 Tax=Burkholderia cepacia TaxID=292 RepID=UPI000F5D64DB
MPRKPKAKSVDLAASPADLLEQFGRAPTTAEAINAATRAFKKTPIKCWAARYAIIWATSYARQSQVP